MGNHAFFIVAPVIKKEYNFGNGGHMQGALKITRILFRLLIGAFACGIFFSSSVDLLLASIGVVIAKTLCFFMENSDDFVFMKAFAVKPE
jgi:hypothetical protein